VGLCYGYWILLADISIFLSLYLQSRKLNTVLSKFLLRIYLNFPHYYLLSNNSISDMIVLTVLQLKPLSFPTMPYSVIMIVAMLWLCVKACVSL